MANTGTPDPKGAYYQSEAQSARTFAMAGFVFYLISSIVGAIGVTAAFFSVIVFVPPPGMMPPGAPFFAPLFPAVYLGAVVVLTWWSWSTVKDIEAGQYAKAHAPTLVLGILGIFLAVLIGGIFLILAYVKIGNVLGPVPTPPPPMVIHPTATQAPGGRICPHCGRPIAMDAQFCSYCGEKLP